MQHIEFVRKSVKDGGIYNAPAVFDIETTSFYEKNEKRACMYAWVFGLCGKCVRGRTWQEFLDLIDVIETTYKTTPKRRFVIYVHNLAYEFQFIRKMFKWEKVFSADERKPIYAITKGGIEFRCSYILSGYSLAKLGENLTKYKVEKKVGDLDYNLVRHSNTPLTSKEWSYILNDGLVVMSYIQEQIEQYGGLDKLPYTNTGFVRNYCRSKCLDTRYNTRNQYAMHIKKMTLQEDEYRQLKRAYTGGFTHANANYAGKTIENVHSFDFTSSYPAVMLSEKYPSSKPFDVEILDETDFKHCLRAFCCMFDIRFVNIRASVEFENYISRSKCIKAVNAVVNNGRVVEADEIVITLTEQDYAIIQDMYKWDYCEVYSMRCMHKDYLPKEFIECILKLYEDKTTLKGVEGKEVEYLLSKGMLNSTYGMCVTDICKDTITYTSEWGHEKADVPELLARYNKNTKRFLYYAWGVWITAYARRNLFSGILEFRNDYIYSDTDSIKVLNIDNHIAYINGYNSNVTRKVEECLDHYGLDGNRAKPRTIKGKEKPIGVWDYEGKYDRFKTLGAKRYITETNGDISITIAGVGKKTGKKYLLHKYANNVDKIFKEFNDGLYFPPTYDCDGVEEYGAGKLCHTYIDEAHTGEIIDYMGNIGTYNELSAVHLEPTGYEMSLESGFLQYLKEIITKL